MHYLILGDASVANSWKIILGSIFQKEFMHQYFQKVAVFELSIRVKGVAIEYTL